MSDWVSERCSKCGKTDTCCDFVLKDGPLGSWGDVVLLCEPCVWKLRRAFKLFMLTPDQASAISTEHE